MAGVTSMRVLEGGDKLWPGLFLGPEIDIGRRGHHHCPSGPGYGIVIWKAAVGGLDGTCCQKLLLCSH